MATRARTLLLVAVVAIPTVAFGHNGRDAGPPKAKPAEKAAPVDFFAGIKITTDPKTGVRSYVQVGDIPDNPGSGKVFVYDESTMGPGVDYWVQKSLETPPPSYTGPAQDYIPADTGTQVEMYDEGYYDGYGYGYGYGGYLPSYGGGGGGRPGRPGHGDGPGHGGGPGNGHGNDGGAIRPPPRAPFSRYSPPAGPPGGGVGSPAPYPFDRAGAGSPTYYPFDATRAPVRGRR